MIDSAVSAYIYTVVEDFYSKYPSERYMTTYNDSETLKIARNKLKKICNWAQPRLKTTAPFLGLHYIEKGKYDIPFSKMNIDLIILQFEDHACKKHVFSSYEDIGYRVYNEFENITVLFLTSNTSRISVLPLDPTNGNVKKALHGSKWENSKLVEENESSFISIPARSLLRYNRFDIAMKAHYGRLFLSNSAPNWREMVYYEQALRITGPGKHIKEHDGSNKLGMQMFLDSFHSLLREPKAENYPYFPIDSDLLALDGAHRIAAAIVNNKPANAIQINTQRQMPSTSQYYMGTIHGHPPCPDIIIDEAAIEYCRIKDTVAIALIFPCTNNSDFALEQLKSIADIVYEKDILMTQKAGQILLRQAYLGEPWLDYSTHESGFLHKVRSCFPYTGRLKVVLLDNYHPKDLRPVKETIRQHYKLGKHSVHISDSSEESLRLAKALFNKNSVHLLSHHTGKYLENFHAKIYSLIEWCKINQTNIEDMCIDSSGVLAAFGLRECHDLDFLYHGEPEKLKSLPAKVECHNGIENLYPYKISDIVGDPRLHFHYMGVKFCTPDIVYQMKKKRGERKDRIDMKYLNAVMCKSSLLAFNRYKYWFILHVYSRLHSVIYRCKAVLKRHLRYYIKLFTRKK